MIYGSFPFEKQASALSIGHLTHEPSLIPSSHRPLNSSCHRRHTPPRGHLIVSAQLLSSLSLFHFSVVAFSTFDSAAKAAAATSHPVNKTLPLTPSHPAALHRLSRRLNAERRSTNAICGGSFGTAAQQRLTKEKAADESERDAREGRWREGLRESDSVGVHYTRKP